MVLLAVVLVLVSPVLEPCLDLGLAESEGAGQLHPLRGGEVPLGGEPAQWKPFETFWLLEA